MTIIGWLLGLFIAAAVSVAVQAPFLPAMLLGFAGAASGALLGYLSERPR